MDTFMDKLAQKLNAQEMIRANSAADAEELGNLRNQVQEYNACLIKLQKLLEDGAAKLDGAQVNGAEVNRLVEDAIAKISQMQKDDKAIDNLKEALEKAIANQQEALEKALEEQKKLQETKLNECTENVHKECVKVYRNVQAVVVEENNKQEDSLRHSIHTVKNKVKVVFGISIAALVMSTAGVVLQVLNMMNFKFF